MKIHVARGEHHQKTPRHGGGPRQIPDATNTSGGSSGSWKLQGSGGAGRRRPEPASAARHRRSCAQQRATAPARVGWRAARAACQLRGAHWLRAMAPELAAASPRRSANRIEARGSGASAACSYHSRAGAWGRPDEAGRRRYPAQPLSARGSRRLPMPPQLRCSNAQNTPE